MSAVARPALAEVGDRARATRAVDAFVAGLQHALDTHDAVAYDAQFAQDVLWGGPFGAIVHGYDAVQAIHRRLQGSRTGAGSRYVVMHVSAPAPGVAVAHVRRLPQDEEATGAFAETVLFVLVERGGEWWLAAGQNTPVQPGRSADGT